MGGSVSAAEVRIINSDSGHLISRGLYTELTPPRLQARVSAALSAAASSSRDALQRAQQAVAATAAAARMQALQVMRSSGQAAGLPGQESSPGGSDSEGTTPPFKAGQGQDAVADGSDDNMSPRRGLQRAREALTATAAAAWQRAEVMLGQMGWEGGAETQQSADAGSQQDGAKGRDPNSSTAEQGDREAVPVHQSQPAGDADDRSSQEQTQTAGPPGQADGHQQGSDATSAVDRQALRAGQALQAAAAQVAGELDTEEPRNWDTTVGWGLKVRLWHAPAATALVFAVGLGSVPCIGHLLCIWESRPACKSSAQLVEERLQCPVLPSVGCHQPCSCRGLTCAALAMADLCACLHCHLPAHMPCRTWSCHQGTAPLSCQSGGGW